VPDAYGYTRLSVNRNGEKESCERQADDIGELADRNGDKIIRMFQDDNLSAWRFGVHRPGWETLLGLVERGAVRLIYVWHLDRFVRQPYDLERFIRAADTGVRVVSWGGGQRDINDPDDRFVLRVETAHACRSSDDTSRRSRAAHRARAEAGVPHTGGQRPFGYRRVPATRTSPATLEARADEAAVVREVYRWYLAGRSMNWIVCELQRRMVDTYWGRATGGVKTVAHRPWSWPSARSILTSPTVAGLRMHGDEVYDGNWPEIVARDVWDEAQGRHGRYAQHAPNPDKYMLSGLLVCGRCRSPLRALPGYKTHRPATYNCRSAQTPYGCGKLTVSAPALDRYLAGALAALVGDPDALRPGEVADAALAEARAAAERARAQLDEIAEDYGANRITRAERDRSRVGPAQRLAEAEKVLADRRPDLDMITGGGRWEALDGWQRRAVARALIEEIVIAPVGKTGRRFDPGRVAVTWR
jgi:DNA invertase Pin-like site-specific DNA recombinase